MGTDHEDNSASGGGGVTGMLDQFRNMDIVNYIGVEDFADQLSYKWTSFLLSGLCSLITMKTYFLHPLACFVPNPVGFAVENQNEYVNNYCWTEGTYSVHPLNFSLSAELTDGGLSAYEDSKIVYYQWVPFVLAVQAVLFYLPRLLWHTASYDRAGTDVAHLVRLATDAASESDKERHEKMVNHASRMLDQMLQRSVAKSCSGKHQQQQQQQQQQQRPAVVSVAFRKAWRVAAVAMPAKLSGSWLILMYLIIKLAYLANVLAQLSLMRHFLGLHSSRYDLLGARILWDVAHGTDWQISGVFPRVGCCAVYMRTAALGNWQFVQCVLPVNMINEKLYIFLWFWFVFVSTATIISLIVWLARALKTSFSNHFVDRMLKLSDNYEEVKYNQYVKSFCRKFLKRDGTFVLKMIALNCGDIICSEIVRRLWTLYRERRGFSHSEADLSSGLFKLKCAAAQQGGVGGDQNESGELVGDTSTRLLRQRRRDGTAGGVGGGGEADAFKNATAPYVGDV